MTTPHHPVMEDMLKRGCTCPKALNLAFQVYMELSEVRRCWDVQYSYSLELGLIYFKTLDHKSQETPELVVPLSAHEAVSPAWLNQVVTSVAKDSNKKVITLAIKDSDSTVLFYKIHEGLEEPMSLEDSQRVRITEERKRLMEADLRKRQDELYDIAITDSAINY